MTKNLTIGSTGPEVETLQRRLNAVSPPEVALPVDKSFGLKTRFMVECFQKRHHLAPTGVVDQLTFHKLQLAAPYAPRPGSSWHREWGLLQPGFANSLRKFLLTAE